MNEIYDNFYIRQGLNILAEYRIYGIEKREYGIIQGFIYERLVVRPTIKYWGRGLKK